MRRERKKLQLIKKNKKKEDQFLLDNYSFKSHIKWKKQKQTVVDAHITVKTDNCCMGSELCQGDSHLGHEVAGVPGMQLSIERQTSLLTFLLFQFEEDSPLFFTQRLQLTSQIL